MKTELITLLIRLIILVITAFVVPALKKWLEARTENEKLQQIKTWALQAVKAAEQMHNKAKKDDPTGEIRREYARKAILRICSRLGVTLTDRDVEALIEAAVQEVNGSGYYLCAEEEVTEDGI